MILGTGIDLLDSRRIDRLFARCGTRFAERCFTACEQAQAAGKAAPGQAILAYAKAFAAKEACAKALGTGFAGGIRPIDIETGRDDAGKPVVALSGRALERLCALTPPGFCARAHLSLSDEPPLVIAQIILELVEDPRFPAGKPGRNRLESPV